MRLGMRQETHLDAVDSPFPRPMCREHLIFNVCRLGSRGYGVRCGLSSIIIQRKVDQAHLCMLALRHCGTIEILTNPSAPLFVHASCIIYMTYFTIYIYIYIIHARVRVLVRAKPLSYGEGSGYRCTRAVTLREPRLTHHAC